MTLLRRLAAQTLKTVIGLSSSANRNWAEAMLAEMHSIPGDWNALAWALGSVRLLFVAQTTLPASLAEIPYAAQTLADRMSARFLVSLVSLVSIVLFFAHFSLHAANTMQQIGAALVVAGTLYLLTQVVGARPRPVPPQADLDTRIRLYRHELIRQRDFYRGRSLWLRIAVLMPGFLLLCLGAIAANPDSVRTQIACLACYFFLSLLAIPNNHRFAERYARQLHNLDALEAKSE